MATSVIARRLTDTHRLAQARLGNQTIGRLRSVWPTLDLNNLDGTFPGWLAAVSPVVRSQRIVSARLAANYLLVFRRIELGAQVRPIVPTLVETVAAEKLATSLRVTGPISIKSNIGRGMSLDAASQIGEERSSWAGMRHALDGGRETLMQTIKADPRAARWARVTSGNACEFCMMLEGRGAVYKEDTVDFESHDHCQCVPEPGY